MPIFSHATFAGATFENVEVDDQYTGEASSEHAVEWISDDGIVAVGLWEFQGHREGPGNAPGMHEDVLTIISGELTMIIDGHEISMGPGDVASYNAASTRSYDSPGGIKAVFVRRHEAKAS